MTETIKFLKIRDVKSPSRANQFDAGIDFYIPRFKSSFIKDLKEKNPDIFGKAEFSYSGNVLIGNGNVTTHLFNGQNNTLSIQGSSGTSTIYNLNDKNDSLIKFDDEKGLNYFLLAPHQRVLIPSGIKSKMATSNRALIAFNKSGIASKFGLVAGSCVVDYLYQGEIHLSVINTSTTVVRIYEDMKLLQFIETPIFNSDIDIVNGCAGSNKDVVDTESFYEGMSTERGENGFGSSDKKENKK